MGFLHQLKLQKFKSGEQGTSKKTKAVEINPSHLIVVAVEKNGDHIEMSNLRIEPRPQSQEALSERIKSIFVEEGLDPRSVRTCLKNTSMVIRILTFPQMKRSELDSMLQYEVEKYIPFKASEVIMDFDILGEGSQGAEGKTLEMILVAVKKNEVKDLCGVFQNAGIVLESLGVSSLAFLNAVEFILPEARESTFGFLDLENESTTFGIVSYGKPVFIRDISFGSTDILKVIHRKLGADAEKTQAGSSEYKSAVEQSIDNLMNEIKLSLGYYMEKIAGAKPMEILYVTGGGFRYFPNLTYLEQQLKVPVRKLEIIEKIKPQSGIDPSLIQSHQDLLAPVLGLCI